MAFVQFPALYDWEPGAVHFIKHVVQRVDGAFQVRGVAEVEIVTFSLQELACGSRFFVTLFAEVYVHPSRKEVLLVPFAFAVAYKHEFNHEDSPILFNHHDLIIENNLVKIRKD